MSRAHTLTGSSIGSSWSSVPYSTLIRSETLLGLRLRQRLAWTLFFLQIVTGIGWRGLRPGRGPGVRRASLSSTTSSRGAGSCALCTAGARTSWWLS